MASFDLIEALLVAKVAYQKNENITDVLKAHFNLTQNTDEIIEIAYELQTGTYIDFYNDNKIIMENYTEELTSLVDPHIDTGDVILDVGSGELTTIPVLLIN